MLRIWKNSTFPTSSWRAHCEGEKEEANNNGSNSSFSTNIIPSNIPENLLIAIPLAAVSVVLLFGAKRGYGKEKRLSNKPVQPQEVQGLAFKALSIGSMLCFGAFSGFSAIFIGVTGITSFEEFGRKSRRLMKTKEEFQESEKPIDENETIDMSGYFPKLDLDEPEESQAEESSKNK